MKVKKMVGRKEIEQIERLYELYGFSKVKEADKFIVFTYSNGCLLYTSDAADD